MRGPRQVRRGQVRQVRGVAGIGAEGIVERLHGVVVALRLQRRHAQRVQVLGRGRRADGVVQLRRRGEHAPVGASRLIAARRRCQGRKGEAPGDPGLNQARAAHGGHNVGQRPGRVCAPRAAGQGDGNHEHDDGEQSGGRGCQARTAAPAPRAVGSGWRNVAGGGTRRIGHYGTGPPARRRASSRHPASWVNRSA